MKKQTKIIVIICLAVLIAAAVVFFVLKKRNRTSEYDGQEQKSEGTSDSDILLKRGDRGDNVVKLQRFLSDKILCRYLFDKPVFMYNGKEMTALEIDGIFGPKTEAACEWWFGKKTVQLSEIN